MDEIGGNVQALAIPPFALFGKTRSNIDGGAPPVAESREEFDQKRFADRTGDRSAPPTISNPKKPKGVKRWSGIWWCVKRVLRKL